MGKRKPRLIVLDRPTRVHVRTAAGTFVVVGVTALVTLAAAAHGRPSVPAWWYGFASGGVALGVLLLGGSYVRIHPGRPSRIEAPAFGTLDFEPELQQAMTRYTSAQSWISTATDPMVAAMTANSPMTTQAHGLAVAEATDEYNLVMDSCLPVMRTESANFRKCLFGLLARADARTASLEVVEPLLRSVVQAQGSTEELEANLREARSAVQARRRDNLSLAVNSALDVLLGHMRQYEATARYMIVTCSKAERIMARPTWVRRLGGWRPIRP
jgi:hypothetical protein